MGTMKEKNENGAGMESEEKPWSKYEGKTTGYVIAACVVAATGGLIFGYDIGISGASSLATYLSEESSSCTSFYNMLRNKFPA